MVEVEVLACGVVLRLVGGLGRVVWFGGGREEPPGHSVGACCC